jgi:dipeptidyl aminopeptidase/acylaminoacyl peptidase
LVVIAYGFNGDYVLQANENLTSYPAQAFARDGMAVLLINEPRYADWTGPDFSRGAESWGYGPLSSVETIVHKLADDGVIDRNNVGFMGHSWGGFWVQFAITHSKLFRAAETHNGGTMSEPGTYWIFGRKDIREVQDHVMSGGLSKDTWKNYLEFSITLNSEKVHTPLLIQASAEESIYAMQYYEALRSAGSAVDFVIYPNDQHVFELPQHRYTSMRRNLNWFEFWLLPKSNVDGDAATTEDYRRWGLLKEVVATDARR